MTNLHTPLLQGVSQFEVDFVIPRVGTDLPVGIDPFLLYKSRDPTFASLHAMMLEAFNAGIEALRLGKESDARRILTFPEVPEIGMGFSRSSKRGSGIGTFLTELIVETLLDSPELLGRGVRHIEEMQLVSLHIGPDRISDIAANLLKRHLVEYTQTQCALWDIPLTSGVPLSHIWNVSTLDWEDGYVDLPRSPFDSTPILFVPRRIVRALPWINYDDFLRLEIQAYLRAKRVRGRLKATASSQKRPARPPKEQVVKSTREDLARVDRYVSTKEESAAEAQPSFEYLESASPCPDTEKLTAQLRDIPMGAPNAANYQRTVLEILNVCFNPELIDGKLEVRTVEGTERRDIIFLNDSDQTFWRYVREEHSSFLTMFECKNTADLRTSDINQAAIYLGDRLGRLGFIVTRNSASETLERKLHSIYNDGVPRKIILVLSDTDLIHMLEIVCHGRNPMTCVRDRYRDFRERVQ